MTEAKYVAIMYSSAWAAAGATAIAGFYFTGSPWCAVVLIIPALISISTK